MEDKVILESFGIPCIVIALNDVNPVKLHI